MPKLKSASDILNQLWEKDRLSRLDHVRSQVDYLLESAKELKKELGKRGSHGVGKQGIEPQAIEEAIENFQEHCKIMTDLSSQLQAIEWILGRTVEELEGIEQ